MNAGAPTTNRPVSSFHVDTKFRLARGLPFRNRRRSQPWANLMPFEALCFIWHTISMRWPAYFHPRFKAEFDELAAAVQDELLALLVPLREYGPSEGLRWERLTTRSTRI
jgi:hypothetical protein